MIRAPVVHEWPERIYNYDPTASDDAYENNEALDTIINEYRQMSTLMVAEQTKPLDKFFDHFLARIGRAIIDEPPMAFQYNQKLFLVRFNTL